MYNISYGITSADTSIRDSKNLIFILVSTGKMRPAIEEVMMLI